MKTESGHGSFFIAAAFALALAGCGGGGNGGSGLASAGGAGGTTTSYTVGGSVSGLAGSLILQNNGGDNLSVSTNGSFTFASPVSAGGVYKVTVLIQPAGQTCTVSNGTGTVLSNVTNVSATCSANTSSTYNNVGGTISGLTGSLVLQNNGGDYLTLTADGNFTFPTKVASGSTYNVSVRTQPAGQTCSVSNGFGTVSGNDVTNVAVVCSLSTYSVWGVVSGLAGSVTLQNNNGDNLTLSANGSFAFPTMLPDGSAYNVTVLSQPATQSCSVANGAGSVSGSNITNLTVTCSAYAYTIGGAATGLNGSMVLQNNGADDLIVSTNGAFTFATAVPFGNPYSVTVLTQPTGQTCTVTGGSGTTSVNVTSVGVNCVTGTGNGSLQGGTVQKALTLAGTVTTSGLLGTPRSVTTDGTYLYWINGNQIYQIDIATGAGALLAGDRVNTAGLTNGTGTAAQFNSPYDLTTDGTNLYVADTANNQIRQIVIATGAVTLLAGSPTGAPGRADGPGTAATFNQPQGITIDGNGANLYVTDWSNHSVRKVVIATGAVTTFAGSTTGLFGTTNGIGTAARFRTPRGITTDGPNLYVVDTGNNEIRKIVIANRAVTLVAGSPTGTSGSTDGTGTAALFGSPGNITTDGTNLYVTEFANHTVRQIAMATWAVTTLAGTVGVAGNLDGTGTAARFNTPGGLTSDGTSLYVGDVLNSAIRRIQ